MSAFGASSTAAASSTQGDISKDVELQQGLLPEDSISEIAFSPTHDFLAVASWDKSVRIYEVLSSGAVEGRWAFQMQGHVLTIAWSRDGTRIAAGGSDKTAQMLNVSQTAQGSNLPTQQIAAHEDTIKCVKWFQNGGKDFVVTGSWDKTVKYWPVDTPGNMAGSLDVKHQVYSMDVRNDLLVIATAERSIHIVNLTKPTDIYKTITSPLKWQTRVVSCFTDATGFAIGSIEGRCAIQYVEDKDTSLNFSFKCHRQQDTTQRDVAKVYSVNAISFHPQHGTFSTAGSDGTFHFWDKDAKHRLKGYPEVGGSITSSSFNHNGNIFAYAISYDWSKGYAHSTPQNPLKLKLHPVGPDECKPRPGTRKR